MAYSPGLGAQQFYALVIGIDKYVLDAPANNLEGAVADAKDIAQSLRKYGAREVNLLTDDQASRARIEAAWFRLIDIAKAGDTLIFTFAGHGSQEPVAVGATDEPDGLNENFLLGGYAPTGQGFKERIVDDEMNLWLKRADDRGLQVIFVADSCHAGSMTRSLGTVAERAIKFRNLPRSTAPLPPPGMTPSPEVAAMRPDDFRNVVFLGAALENQKTPEIKINGEPRGAMSWAFARAMEGAADANKDGLVTLEELTSYIRATVFKLAETQQTPTFAPTRSLNRVVFALQPARQAVTPPVAQVAPPTVPSGTVAPTAGRAILTFAVVASRPVAPIPGVAIVGNPGDADLVWTEQDGTVRHRVGGVVAQGITAATVPTVLAKWMSLEILKAISTEVAPIEVASGNQIYKRGALVRLSLARVDRPHLTVFNFPPFGRVDFLVPGSGRASSDRRGASYAENFQVNEPPFGAEHIVAIVSDSDLTDLHAVIAQARDAQQMLRLPDELRRVLAGKRIAIGIAPVYTSGEPCRKAVDGAACFREY